MVSTKNILKYKREADSWVCPWCDMENNILLGKCTLCGAERTNDAAILRQWTEADDRPVAAYTTVPPAAGTRPARPVDGPVFSDDGYYPPPENKSSAGKIWLTILAFLLITLALVIGFYDDIFAAEFEKSAFNSANQEAIIAEEMYSLPDFRDNY